MEGMPKEFQHLRVRLLVEQCRLINWGEDIGLAEEQLENPSQFLKLHRNLIVDIMLEIQQVFRGCMKIREKYEKLVPLPADATGDEDADSPLSRDHNHFVAKTLRFIEKIPQTKLRLQWALIK